MALCFASFAALLCLFAAACCAPTGHLLQDACGDVRASSLELNRIAHSVSKKARNGSQDLSDFPSTVAWMEAKDMCDPETLKQKSAMCLGKMLNVLTSYIPAVQRVANFKQCSEFVDSQVMPAMQRLHADMSKCVKSRAGVILQKNPLMGKEATEPVHHWEEDLLCRDTMDRLFSFSILTARVFAVGDPAHHADGSAQKCM